MRKHRAVRMLVAAFAAVLTALITSAPSVAYLFSTKFQPTHMAPSVAHRSGGSIKPARLSEPAEFQWRDSQIYARNHAEW